MRFYQWASPHGNVGDDLNGWLWPRLFGPGVFDDSTDPLLIGIGSVLDDRHADARTCIVFGAGLRGPAAAPDVTAPGWTVDFVRGPKSAAVLGLGADRWISDPAILASRANPALTARPAAALPKGRPEKIGFVPYFKTPIALASGIATAAGMHLIPVTLAPERFIQNLLACDAVVCEAMHGAILADTFGVPWMGCRILGHITEGATHHFKWADWLETLELDPHFVTLPSIGKPLGRGLVTDLAILLTIRRAAAHLRPVLQAARWTLSDRSLLAARQDEMLQRIVSLKARLVEH